MATNRLLTLNPSRIFIVYVEGALLSVKILPQQKMAPHM
jgi:hypothetical protein